MVIIIKMVIYRNIALFAMVLVLGSDLFGRDTGTVHLRFRHDLGSEEGSFKVTRWDYLLSRMAVRYAGDDENWIESDEWYGYVSAGSSDGRAFELTGVPLGRIVAIRFQIGLDPEVNDSDQNAWPPQHALNPQVNGLQWEWQGGYIFMALEGLLDEEKEGFSYHLAKNGNSIVIELPVEFELRRGATINISAGIDRLINEQGVLPKRDGTSTHSRAGDPILSKLKSSIATAFEIESVVPDLFQARQDGGGGTSKALSDAGLAPVSRRFPQVKLPDDNPLSEPGIRLGRELFNEPLLSKSNAQSCSSCHDRNRAFSDDVRFSVGAVGIPGKRNSMPLFNLAWHNEFFWDGRVATLREQALHPITDPTEMAETMDNVLEKLGKDEEYPQLFQAAFGDPRISGERIGLAIEQFLLTLISQNSKFDQAARGEVNLTDQERRGLELFVTEHDPVQGKFGADCFHCHGGNLFVSKPFANNGLDSVFTGDGGLGAITGNSGDIGKFKVPSLRNIEVTGPYMHDGRFATLEEVVEHYNSGVKRSDTLDPNLAKHPATGLNLSSEDKEALVAFLKTLTDDKFLNFESMASEGDRECNATFVAQKSVFAK